LKRRAGRLRLEPMKILVINAGSSSIKYQLFDLDRRRRLAGGLLERIGEEGGRLRHELSEPVLRRLERPEAAADHRLGMAAIMAVLTAPEVGAIGAAAEIGAVGHRVVHGGERFFRPALIDAAVLAAIGQNIPLAPLHNPANLAGIEAARAFFPSLPQVAVFDTAFHQTIPAPAFLYGLPLDLYHHLRIRRYGFHGTSHQHLAKAAARMLGRPLAELNLITLHLGNGASITAISGGRSVDTSMGMTPLEGLLMGTRCGDLDPAIPSFLAQNARMTIPEIDSMLNQQSGLKGLCGTNDMREILSRIARGDEQARLALDIYAYRIRKYIGAYFAVLGRVDALVFSAGIGQNSPEVRELALRGLSGLGILLDPSRNRAAGSEGLELQAADSRVKVLVIPANEELEIAEQTLEVVKGLPPA